MLVCTKSYSQLSTNSRASGQVLVIAEGWGYVEEGDSYRKT